MLWKQLVIGTHLLLILCRCCIWLGSWNACSATNCPIHMNFVSIWTPSGNEPPAKGFWPRFGAYQLFWQDSFACCVALRFFKSLGKCLPGEFTLAAKHDFNKFRLGLLHSRVVDKNTKTQKQSPTEGAKRKHWSPTGILTATACWQTRCVELITWKSCIS